MLKGRVSSGKTMLWRPEGSEVFVVLFLILLLYTKPKILLHFHREIPEWLLQVKVKSGTPWNFKFSIPFLWADIRTPNQRSALACLFSDSGPRWRRGQTLLLWGTCVHNSLKTVHGQFESGLKAPLKTTETESCLYMRLAGWKAQAGFSPSEIQFVQAHGNSFDPYSYG